MEEYFAKQKEVDRIVQFKAEEIATNLIKLNVGKSTADLRSSTLEYIRKNSVPEVISNRIKHEIEHFIVNIKIPAQKN